jgi:hypothetical protein
MNPDHALEHNLWSLWSNLGLGPGCALHDEPDLLWFETPIAALPYNTVLRFKVASNIDRRLDAVAEHLRRRSVPQLWVLHPTAAPADLDQRLERRGIHEIEAVAGMAADLSALPKPSPLPADIEARR